MTTKLANRSPSLTDTSLRDSFYCSTQPLLLRRLLQRDRGTQTAEPLRLQTATGTSGLGNVEADLLTETTMLHACAFRH